MVVYCDVCGSDVSKNRVRQYYIIVQSYRLYGKRFNLCNTCNDALFAWLSSDEAKNYCKEFRKSLDQHQPQS